MTFVMLGLSQALATYAIVTTVVSAIVYMIWRIVRRDSRAVTASSRASGLFLLRMLPTMIGGVVTVGICWSAYLKFEPRDTTESVGIVVGIAAMFGAGFMTAAGLRVWHAWRATRSIAADWRSSATRIDLPGVDVAVFRLESSLPIVSIVGVGRPQLFMARSVLEHCTPAQIDAIVAHETSHLRAGDNLRRLALRGSADPLAFSRVGSDIERAWADASEEAADDSAVGGLSIGACDLAEALLRVARLASGRSLANLPGATLSRGSVAHRVHRLLSGHRDAPVSPRWVAATRVLTLSAPLAVPACLLHPTTLRGVHEVFEVLQRVLP